MEFKNPHGRESSAEIKKRLLGLRDFPVKTFAERSELLGGSDDRNIAYDRISTSTLPTDLKREVKKGVVLEILEKGIIPEGILEKNPLVYIGSGVDIEYPLALGARTIIMVDPIFSDKNAIAEVIESIRLTTLEDVTVDKNGLIVLPFDFGKGNERVVIHLETKPYIDGDEEGYVLPENTGVIVLYASQGPAGMVRVTDDMKQKLVEGGVILEETNIHSFSKEKKEEIVTELGK